MTQAIEARDLAKTYDGGVRACPGAGQVRVAGHDAAREPEVVRRAIGVGSRRSA